MGVVRREQIAHRIFRESLYPSPSAPSPDDDNTPGRHGDMRARPFFFPLRTAVTTWSSPPPFCIWPTNVFMTWKLSASSAISSALWLCRSFDLHGSVWRYCSWGTTSNFNRCIRFAGVLVTIVLVVETSDTFRAVRDSPVPFERREQRACAPRGRQ